MYIKQPGVGAAVVVGVAVVVGGALPAALSPMLRLQLLTPYVKKLYDLSAGIWLAPESTFRVRVRV